MRLLAVAVFQNPEPAEQYDNDPVKLTESTLRNRQKWSGFQPALTQAAEIQPVLRFPEPFQTPQLRQSNQRQLSFPQPLFLPPFLPTNDF
ncbi:MAG TPA: hypothetical protein VE127_14140 [Solirubrobacteraceae bacterium]|jgi:hypothetical protein|nr:hypothetical protein [Solirubrobacteraceae bacterium]